MDKLIPKVSNLVNSYDRMAKLDTFDLTKGHLSKLPAVPEDLFKKESNTDLITDQLDLNSFDNQKKRGIFWKSRTTNTGAGGTETFSYKFGPSRATCQGVEVISNIDMRKDQAHQGQEHVQWPQPPLQSGKITDRITAQQQRFRVISAQKGQNQSQKPRPSSSLDVTTKSGTILKPNFNSSSTSVTTNRHQSGATVNGGIGANTGSGSVGTYQRLSSKFETNLDANHSRMERQNDKNWDARNAIENDQSQTIYGLTHSEKLQAFDKRKKKLGKSVKINVPKPSSQGHPAALNQIISQNEIFGPLLKIIQDGYEKEIASLEKQLKDQNLADDEISRNRAAEKAEVLNKTKNFKCQDSATDDLLKISETTHNLETETKNLLNELSEIDEKIKKEQERITAEQVHFEKFKFLHHEKPIIKSAPVLDSEANWYENVCSDTQKMNVNFHKVVELVANCKELEADIHSKTNDIKVNEFTKPELGSKPPRHPNDEETTYQKSKSNFKRMVLREEFNRNKMLLDDLELEKANQRDVFDQVLERNEDLKRSVVHFLETVGSESLYDAFSRISGEYVHRDSVYPLELIEAKKFR